MLGHHSTGNGVRAHGSRFDLMEANDMGNICEYQKDKEPVYRMPTRDEAFWFIGLKTNVSYETNAQWLRRMQLQED